MITKAALEPEHGRVSGAMCVLLALVAQPALASRSKDKPKKEKPYALIFGTAYGPNDRPFYGVKITIRPQKKKHPSWELMSDHRGEFAQRVPAGTNDYLVHGEAEYAPVGDDGKPQLSKRCDLRVKPGFMWITRSGGTSACI